MKCSDCNKVNINKREIKAGDIVKCIDNFFGYDREGNSISYYLTKGKEYRVKFTVEYFGKTYCCVEDDEGNETCYRVDRFI